MAYDKLVDSSQLNSDLGDVADAIRAKSGGSSQLAFPSGFISEIGNISTGGGGSLPSIISKIDGGSFTPSSDTVTGNYTISHNLGEAPKGVAIWATNMDRVAYSVRVVDYYLATLGNYVLEQVNTNALRRELSGAVASGDIGSNSIKMTISQNYYKANTTYNWLAWV